MRVSVTPFGTVIGAEVVYNVDAVPEVHFGHGVVLPLDLLVLDRFDLEFRKHVVEHGKAPTIVHRDGNLHNCVRSNLAWEPQLVVSKYFAAKPS